MNSQGHFIVGGIYGTAGFIGCMRLITVDGNYMLPTDWKLGVNINDLLNYK
jgi:hypothetical protein